MPDLHRSGRINYLITIAGPTASGKTKTGIQLARHFKCPIISADSRQFYKEMRIGTAVPSEEELRMATHYFIRSHSITDELNVGLYEREALGLLKDLFLQYDKVILLGGSGLYIKALCEGLDDLPVRDEAIRAELVQQWQEKGISSLVNMLNKLDPVYAGKADLKNPHRLIRALEVCLLSGKPYSSFRKGIPVKRPFKHIKTGIYLPRPVLYEHINERVDRMMEAGLLDEARELYPYRQLNPLQTVGYAELFEYFDGKISLERAVELIKQHTRQFAKRQFTWFMRDPEIRWFLPQELKELVAYVEEQIRKEE